MITEAVSRRQRETGRPQEEMPWGRLRPFGPVVPTAGSDRDGGGDECLASAGGVLLKSRLQQVSAAVSAGLCLEAPDHGFDGQRGGGGP